MCGIIGYVGQDALSNTVLIEGLQALEYRGYDSAGIAITGKKGIQLLKAKGKVSVLKEKLTKHALCESTCGIAHTRWATHGEPSERNSHPHQSGHVTLVHNGIIENYLEIKEELTNAGYHFQSQTDSEIAAAYIDSCYKQSGDPMQALADAYHHFRGSFAFVILFDDQVETLYAMRKNSPLVLGIGSHASYVSSDLSAFLKYTTTYLMLEPEEIAVCRKDGIALYTLDQVPVQRAVQVSTMKAQDIQKGNYEHFMLKEIHEEPRVVMETITSLLQDDRNALKAIFPSKAKYQRLHIVACGSALYAGMIAKSLIETTARIPVDCVCASEYRYAHPIYSDHTLVILISQSGETADTLASLQLAKANNIATLAIVNVVDSTLARDADHVLYTKAGSEICVATTKAYCTQVATLSMLAYHLASLQGILDPTQEQALLQDVCTLPQQLKTLIQKDYTKLASDIFTHQDVFFIGRGLDYALSLEGSLKLKEISYIHSEAYPAGELKHGTISLIEKGTPVIALATDEELYEKTISNIKEVKARGAYVLLLIREDFAISSDFYDAVFILPKTHHLLQALFSVIPLQLLAYEIAKLRGCEIDQPRNLAKSVTVE